MTWLVLMACGTNDQVDATSEHIRGEPYDGDLYGQEGDEDDDGWKATEGDCDDGDAAIHPGAPDTWYDGVDSDCGGNSDYDADGDLSDSASHGGSDCDDEDPAIGPQATETCNEVDDDCDGNIDDADANLSNGTLVHADGDGDGFGEAGGQRFCVIPGSGWISDGSDCDDTSAVVWPGAPDIACDGYDNDCDPSTWEAGAVTVNGTITGNLVDALASAPAGAIVELCEGSYTGPFTITERMELHGAGSALTVLDGALGGSVLTTNGVGPLTLEGMTVRGGSAPRGGGVLIDSPLAATFIDVVVTGNSADVGAGIHAVAESALVLVGATVSDNVAVENGGGIYLGDRGTLSMTNTTIDANHGGYIGGGGLDLGFDVVVDGGGSTLVSDNTAARGGGIKGDGSVVLSGVDIEHNSASSAGGMDVFSGHITDVTFSDNVADVVGTISQCGGLDMADGMLLRVGFYRNEAELGSAFCGWSDFPGIAIVDSVVQENDATWNGTCAAVLMQGKLASIDTDWGELLTDNAPADVHMLYSGETYTWDGVADFECSASDDTCG